ncbi:MAG: cytochrome c biogenesis protein CcdA [Planctomycetaceae bacterium]
MRTATLAAFLAALGLLSPLARAEPTVRLTTDRAMEGSTFFSGAWIDLLVTVDPAGSPVAVDGLVVTAEVGKGGGELRPSILPPPDSAGAYAAPFTIRVPMRAVGEGETALRASVKGKLASGAPFEASGEGSAFLFPPGESLVASSVALKRASVGAGEPNALVATLEVKEGYHVYGASSQYEPRVSALLLPGGPRRLWSGGGPAGTPGEEVHGAFEIEVPFTPLVSGRVETRLQLFYAVCDESQCFPAEVVYLAIAFDVAPGSGVVTEAPPPPSGGSGGGRKGFEGGFWKLLLAAVGAGLFALAMPCTYPLIPITISFFTKQAEQRHGRVLPLALAYGAGIVAIFTGIGLVVGGGLVAGARVLDFATLWWVNALFAFLFLVFGLSLVGLFEIRLPGVFNDLAAKASGTGGYLSVFAMGTTLVITSFTCTAPFVGSLLVWAAGGGKIGPVALAMGVFGLTMAVPFVFLSLSPQGLKKLPRSGEWMKRLKVTLGILELGLVLKFVSGIDLAIGTFKIGRELFIALWGISFLVAALYLLGLFEGFRGRLTAGRGLAAAFLLLFTLNLASGLGGAPVYALPVLEAFFPILPVQEGEEETGYGTALLAVVYEDYEKGVELARAKGAPIFLHFTGFQ